MITSALIRGVFLLLMLVLSQGAIAGKDVCSDILKSGTLATSLYSSKFEYRRLLESRLVHMTYQEAKTDTSFTGNIPIGDIILGVGFDQKTFDVYKTYLQQNIALRVDVSKSVDILLSTGDPTIVGAWSDCMKNKSGMLSVFFSEIHATSAVLNLEWHPAAGVAKVKIKQDYEMPKGVTVVSGKDIMSGKEFLVAGTAHQVQFAFAGLKDVKAAAIPVALTINVEKENGGLAGADSVYLPARFVPFLKPRPYDFATGQCDKLSLIGVDARERKGASATTTYCSDSVHGWRFTPSALHVQPIVAIPGQIPGTFANYQAFWSGDFQVTILLGCSNSSRIDIQCQATTSLQEEKWFWKVLDDVDSRTLDLIGEEPI